MIKEGITWDELCERGRIAGAKCDESRWEIGDLAIEVDRTYRDRGIEEFAKEIGRPKSTVYSYESVSRTYDEILRRRISEDCPNLTYTYFRSAVRFKDTHRATEWLYQASENGWTVDENHRLITEAIKHKPRETMEGEIYERYKDGENTFIVMRIREEYPLEAGQIVTLKTKREA